MQVVKQVVTGVDNMFHKRGLRILTHQILIKLWNIKSSITARYNLAFLVLRYAETTGYEVIL